MGTHDQHTPATKRVSTRVTVSVAGQRLTIDADAWSRVYGIPLADVPADVRTTMRTAVRDALDTFVVGVSSR